MSRSLLPRLILGIAAFVALLLAFVVGIALEVPVGGAILVGMAVIAGVASWWVGKRGAQNDALTAEFEARQASAPDAPWTWREEWAETRYTGRPDRVGSVIAVVAVATLVCYVGAAVVVIVLGGEWDVQWLGLLVMAVFVYKPLKRMLLRRRTGPTTLVLEDVPVRLGGRLHGVARTGLGDVPTDVRVRLACIERRITRIRNTNGEAGSTRSVSETVRWEVSQSAEARSKRAEAPSSRPQQIVVPFSFHLPPSDEPGVEPTTTMPAWREEHAPSRILWCVEVVADVGGADFESRVEIPVFAAPDLEDEAPAATRTLARPAPSRRLGLEGA